MITKVEVMPEKDFDAWYQGEKKAGKAGATVAKKREAAPDAAKLIEVKGCTACHTIDGTPKLGPTLKGLFGKKETVTRDGKEVEIVVDEAFIRGKLLEPEKERVKGFPPVMPSQKGLLMDKEVDAIIEYLKTLK
jgi:cytochrome c oxidase subunit 2